MVKLLFGSRDHLKNSIDFLCHQKKLIFPMIIMTLALFIFIAPASAYTYPVEYGNYTYTVLDEAAKTAQLNYIDNASGTVKIPNAVNGYTIKSLGSPLNIQGVTETSIFRSYPGYPNTKVTNVIIPNSITSIGMSAFDTCHGILSVTIPDSVIYIGQAAFCSCWNLTNLTLPNSVTLIDTNAFAACHSLTTLTIPNSVTTIGLYAFQECTRLTSVMIPDSVIYIEAGAFWNCYNLTSAYFLGNAPTTSTNFGDCVFEDTAPSFKIFYIQGKSGWTTPTWTSPARPFSHPYDVYNTATFVPFSVSGCVTTMNGKGKSGVIMTFSSSSSIAVPIKVTTDANGYWTQTGFVTGFTYRVVPPGGYKMYYPSYIDFSKSSTTLNFTQKLINPFPWLKNLINMTQK